MHRILVATDLSETARHAFDAATRWALDTGALLVLVHAQEPIPASVGIAGGNLQRDIQEKTGQQYATDAHQLTEQWAEQARKQGVDVELVLGAQEPAAFILAEAIKQDAAMIVVGTHGRRGLSRLLMGSVAQRVVQGADRPVLVVPGA